MSHPNNSERGYASEARYVVLRRGDVYMAHPARGLDCMGGGTTFTREQIDRSAIGASVTYCPVPPSVKIDNVSDPKAVLLWGLSAGVLTLLGWLFRRRD